MGCTVGINQLSLLQESSLLKSIRIECARSSSSSEEIKNLFFKKEKQIKMEHCIQSYITSTSLLEILVVLALYYITENIRDENKK